jgi:hypothetical protein
MVVDEDLESASEVDEIKQDIHSECSGFGAVEEVLMPNKGDRPLAIYVRFTSSEFAFVAIKKLSGRTFSERTIAAKYYDIDDFNNKKRTQELEAMVAASALNNNAKPEDSDSAGAGADANAGAEVGAGSIVGAGSNNGAGSNVGAGDVTATEGTAVETTDAANETETAVNGTSNVAAAGAAGAAGVAVEPVVDDIDMD